MARPTPAVSPPHLIIHEVSNSDLKHRIVTVDPTGATAGKWAPLDLIAVLDEYLANVAIENLPIGVFTVSEINFKLLES